MVCHWYHGRLWIMHGGVPAHFTHDSLQNFGWEISWRENTFRGIMGGHNIEMYIMKTCLEA